MNTRLPLLLWSLLLGCLTSSLNAQAPALYDVVIAGGRVIDPESGLDAVRHVGISGGVIRSVSVQPLTGQQVIDAHGLVVAPGFIDLHQHAHSPDALRAKVHDGVTAAFEMEMGVPDIRAWYDSLQGTSPIHFGAAASHMYHRVSVLTGTAPRWDFPSGPGTTRAATPAEIDSLRLRIANELQQGAIGVGLGIEYTPGATPWEVLAMFRTAAEFPGAPVHVHVRGTEPPQHWMETAELFLGAVTTRFRQEVCKCTSGGGLLGG